MLIYFMSLNKKIMKLRKNRKILYFLILSATIILIFNFSNYFSYLSPPKGSVFTGQVFIFDPWDINVYVSAIKWAQHNGFEYQNAYTTTTHKSVIIYPLYTLVGYLFPKINPFFLYHTLIAVCGTIMLGALYKTIKVFTPEKSNYLVYLVAIIFAGGIEWVFFLPFKAKPYGLKTIYFTFQNVFERPHTMLALTAYIISLTLFYLSIKRRESRLNYFSALGVIIFSIFYPYHVLSFYVIVTLFAFIWSLQKNKKYPIEFLFKSVAVTLPLVGLYSLYLFRGRSFMPNVFAPNELQRANLIKILISFGIYVPFIIYQLKLIKKGWVKNNLLFLNIWLLASASLTFLPLSFSRYYLRGLYLPLVIIALVVLKELLKKRKLQIMIMKPIITVAGSATTLLFLLAQLSIAQTPSSVWAFMPKEKYEAVEYLNNNSLPGSGVLAKYPFSNHIPAHTLNRVYFGHYFQTPNSSEKIDNLNKFYSYSMTEAEAENFLVSNNIIYVYIDEKEDENNQNSEDFKQKYSFLEQVGDNVSLYSY